MSQPIKDSCSSPLSGPRKSDPTAGRDFALYRVILTIGVSETGSTLSTFCVDPLNVMTAIPWADRVDLGARLAVWKIRHRPSVEMTVSSVSSLMKNMETRGDLSEYAFHRLPYYVGALGSGSAKQFHLVHGIK